MTQKHTNWAIRALVVGAGLSSVAFGSALTHTETFGKVDQSLSLSTQIAQVRASPAESSSAIANSIKASLVPVTQECFGQSSGTSGACGYSQDAGCTYSQNCHPTA